MTLRDLLKREARGQFYFCRISTITLVWVDLVDRIWHGNTVGRRI